jgi:hypothetical protein
MNMLGLSSNVYFAHRAFIEKFFLVNYIQVLCQYRLCRADHAYLTYLMLQRQPNHLKRIVQSQNQSYFTTGGLPPISSSWRQALEAHDQRFFSQLNYCGNSPYITSSLTRRWLCLLWICLAFRQCTFRTYNILLKILPSALHTSPISVQDLQSRSCLTNVFYATTAA